MKKAYYSMVLEEVKEI